MRVQYLVKRFYAAGKGRVFDLSDIDFEEKVKNGNGTVIVDCWAEWCGPCKKLTPLLTDAVNKVEGDVVLYKVNVDMNERIPEALEVTAIPAVFAFYKGEVIASFVGVPSQEEVETWVQNVADPKEILEYLDGKKDLKD